MQNLPECETQFYGIYERKEKLNFHNAFSSEFYHFFEFDVSDDAWFDVDDMQTAHSSTTAMAKSIVLMWIGAMQVTLITNQKKKEQDKQRHKVIRFSCINTIWAL